MCRWLSAFQINFICFKNTYTQTCKVFKDSFNFASEFVDQDSSNFMGSLDIDSLLTNIFLKETIRICTNILYKNNEIIHGLKKMNLKIFYL